MMQHEAFDRTKHVYNNEAFDELVKDAVRFFHGTPVRPISPMTKFSGSGVYALYYAGKLPMYSKYFNLNRLAYNHPIYVGKAVPSGWRQARIHNNPSSRTHELFTRLKEHSRSLEQVSLSVDDFSCRFMIFEEQTSDMIGTIEAALIKLHKPLWNTVLDGFGNHDPGKGRYKQAKSDWDVIHPGRGFAANCQGIFRSLDDIVKDIEQFFGSLEPRS